MKSRPGLFKYFNIKSRECMSINWAKFPEGDLYKLITIKLYFPRLIFMAEGSKRFPDQIDKQ